MTISMAALVALGLCMLTLALGKRLGEHWKADRRELERLKESYQAGDWPGRTPTPDMQELEQMFLRITQELETLKANPDPAREAQLKQWLEQCRNAWFSMDVQRRMNLDYALASSIFVHSA